jgi:hypothetical protein
MSMARYFYKVFKTVIHKPTANSEINIFYNKCVYKYVLQLYNKAFSVTQTVFIKQELIFEKLHFLQNLDCNS